MTLLTRSPILQRIVLKTSAELASPTAAMIADYSALYVLSSPPYTRYVSNGTTLVGASTVDTLATLVAQVASLSSSVNSRASDAQLRDRSTHTGNDPASKSLMDDGTTVQAAVTALRQATVPANASDPAVGTSPGPTIAGTKTVGSTLTITPASVSEGAGGAHTNLYIWYRVNASNLAAPIPGATALTYILSAADLNFYIYATQQAQDTVTGRLSVAVSTTLTAVITGTAPTNSVAPTLSPSGTQAAGVVITCSTGTWANASTYGYLFYDNGVAIGTRSSTATTTLTSAQAGHAITADVLATSSLNVPAAAAVAASNTVTVAGTNTVVNTVLPTITRANGEGAGVIYNGFTYPIVAGTWTLNGNATTPTTRQWDFYKNGVYYASNSVATFNVDVNYALTDVFKLVETVVMPGESTSRSSSLSSATPYTVNAAPATLTVQVNTSTATFISGSSISPYIPVTATGGTDPKTWSVNPALAGTLSMNTSTGQISGTANTVSNTTHTISILDSAAATVTGQTTIIIQPSQGISTLMSIHANTPFAQQNGNLATNGQFVAINTLSDTLSGGYAGPTAVNGFNSRFGKFTDPNGGRTVFRLALAGSDADTQGPVKRTDLSWYGSVSVTGGQTVWDLVELYMPAQTIAATDNADFGLELHGESGTISTGHYLQLYPSARYFVVAGEGVANRYYDISAYVTADTWQKYIVKTFISASGSGTATLWIDGVLRVSDTGVNWATTGNTLSYPKMPLYVFSFTDGTKPTRWYYFRSRHVVLDAGYTVQQVGTLLT